MDKWIGRVALVTGASSGIGASLVRELVKHGMTVVGCARNTDKIQKLTEDLKECKGKVVSIKCNLRNEEEILSMFDKIESDLGRLDVCVNSAGLSRPAYLQSGDTEAWREMLEVNVLALSICTRESLKLMKAKNITDGHIIHISSMSGHRMLNGDGCFQACTKYAVRALTEGLRRELLSTKSDTRVTSISPGVVDTELRARKYNYDEEAIRKVTVPFKKLDAQDVADAVVYALAAAPHVQVHDILLRPNHQPT